MVFHKIRVYHNKDIVELVDPFDDNTFLFQTWKCLTVFTEGKYRVQTYMPVTNSHRFTYKHIIAFVLWKLTKETLKIDLNGTQSE